MVVRAPVLGSGPGLSAPAPARREFSGEARKPEASRNCPSLSSQAVNASAASCTGNERPCCMRHRPLTTLESFLSSRCNTQRQGKKESSISFTFTSRTTQCLPDFCLAPPSSPLPLLTLLIRPLYSISLHHLLLSARTAPQSTGRRTPSEATLGRCGVLPHLVQLFRPCVRRARTLDQVDHPRKPHQPLGHPLLFNRADLPFFFLFRHFFQLRRDCHGATRLGVAIDQTHGARLSAS